MEYARSPTDENAHPHTGCSDRVAVVHNRIISNDESLKSTLTDAGHTFESDTDTETVPHLIERFLDRGYSPAESFRHAIKRLDGSYAIAAIFHDSDEIYATRRQSRWSSASERTPPISRVTFRPSSNTPIG